MDRSFLSNEDVIAESRKFVCIRTATYEDEKESEFIRATILGGAEDLRNFGFCILSSDGSETLRVSKRGPNFLYSDSNALAEDLSRIARGNTSRPGKGRGEAPGVPQMKNFRLGLNVASCDGLPSVVIFGKSDAEMKRLTAKLNEVIWDEELIGKFVYASTRDFDELENVTGIRNRSGILIIKPDEFGTKGDLITSIRPDAAIETIRETMLRAADGFEREEKSHREHVRKGKREGEHWETEVPIPDRDRGSSSGRRGNRNQGR